MGGRGHPWEQAAACFHSAQFFFQSKAGPPLESCANPSRPKSRGHLTRPQSEERRDCHSGAEGPRGCRESMFLPRNPRAGAEALVFWWPSQRSFSQ